MSEVIRYEFTYKEVAEALVKKLDIHEGIWSITAQMSFDAVFLGPSPNESRPAAIVRIAKFGLFKVNTESNLSVDASKVNPLPKGMARGTKRSAKT